jgi:hypothetical protein
LFTPPVGGLTHGDGALHRHSTAKLVTSDTPPRMGDWGRASGIARPPSRTPDRSRGPAWSNRPAAPRGLSAAPPRAGPGPASRRASSSPTTLPSLESVTGPTFRRAISSPCHTRPLTVFRTLPRDALDSRCAGSLSEGGMPTFAEGGGVGLTRRTERTGAHAVGGGGVELEPFAGGARPGPPSLWPA